MAIQIENFEIEGLKIITSPAFADDRGVFYETFKSSDYGEFPEFLQDNLAFSKKNVIRGLHFQKNPHTQAKLVRCVFGHIWDVAVDMRAKSPTFGKWKSFELKQNDGKAFFIPKGFAHGFLTLSEVSVVSYKMTKEYVAESESGVIWNDDVLKINWPVINAIISTKDKKLPFFKESYYF